MTTIAIDCMGGDYGPRVMVPAALHALSTYPHLKTVLFGRSSQIEPFLTKVDPEVAQRLEVINADDVVEMTDKPSSVIRGKRDSSMRRALEAVRDQRSDACVSAGNTGALMALSRLIVKTIPGIYRPAIISAIPGNTKHTLMLDLGANVDCDAETLFQFALMGSIVSKSIDGIEQPSVGLLNIGEEEIKGSDSIKQAASLIAQCHALNYAGFIEANDIFFNKCDVVVTDGFTGNNVLKTSEGVIKILTLKLKQLFNKNIISRCAGLILKPFLKSFKQLIDPDGYNGATFVGLQGIVVKSHGAASVAATVKAIEEAMQEVDQNVPQQIATQVEEVLSTGSDEYV